MSESIVLITNLKLLIRTIGSHSSLLFYLKLRFHARKANPLPPVSCFDTEIMRAVESCWTNIPRNMIKSEVGV